MVGLSISIGVDVTGRTEGSNIINDIIAQFKSRGGTFEAESCLRSFLNTIT